jgi:hypothetical protein
MDRKTVHLMITFLLLPSDPPLHYPLLPPLLIYWTQLTFRTFCRYWCKYLNIIHLPYLLVTSHYRCMYILLVNAHRTLTQKTKFHNDDKDQSSVQCPVSSISIFRAGLPPQYARIPRAIACCRFTICAKKDSPHTSPPPNPPQQPSNLALPTAPRHKPRRRMRSLPSGPHVPRIHSLKHRNRDLLLQGPHFLTAWPSFARRRPGRGLWDSEAGRHRGRGV